MMNDAWCLKYFYWDCTRSGCFFLDVILDLYKNIFHKKFTKLNKDGWNNNKTSCQKEIKSSL